MVSTATLLWRLLTSHGKLYSMAFVKKQLFATSVRSPRIRALSFHLLSAWFTMYVPDSYWTSVLFATLSTYFSLVSSFCSSDQMFAADFFQIPPRDGRPCLYGYTIPTIRARWGLAPVKHYSCRAYQISLILRNFGEGFYALWSFTGQQYPLL